MLYPIFLHAGRSVNRQSAFRWLLAMHLTIIGGTAVFGAALQLTNYSETIGFSVLIAGIVEGAIVVGWRLTQLPKSRSLEPMLLSPVPAPRIMIGEQLVGLTLLVNLCTSSAPVILGLVVLGLLDRREAAAYLMMALTWGCVTGFGLVWWAYEPAHVRRVGERVCLIGILIYLVVFGLAGEHLFRWLAALPLDIGVIVHRTILGFDENNPFGLVHQIAAGGKPGLATRMVLLEIAGVVLTLAFLARSAWRLKGHYVERHYRISQEERVAERHAIDEHPLSWWADLRVSEYPGRINLWLALCVSALYATFLLFGNYWPKWLGTNLFRVFELIGGVPGFVTVLMLLSAVPAAYQYGLWDSSIPERCRRLELFLMTQLGPVDYLRASWSAAWRRGRGYLAAAVLLWVASVGAHRFTPLSAMLAALAGMSVVLLYFAVGFRNFARSQASTAMGFLLTVGLPLLTWALGAGGLGFLAACLPPGVVYYATVGAHSPAMVLSVIAANVVIASWLLRRALLLFDVELRGWYDQHHGAR